MSKSESGKWLAVGGRALLAYALFFSQDAWARQNPQTQGKASSNAAAQPTSEKQSPTAAVDAKMHTKEVQGEESESAVAGERHGDPSHQGIKVHGHWTIEVRNPDGSVAKHIDFENSIDSGFTVTGLGGSGATPVNAVAPGGAAYLIALLTGKWPVPDHWQIWLLGASGLNMNFSLGSLPTGPCGGFGAVDTTDGFVLNGNCVIWQQTSAAPCPGNSPGLSCNLSVTPLGTSPAFTGIQLIGSVQVTSNSQIYTVATILGNVTGTPSVNPSTGAITLAPYTLDSLTSSTNFPGAPMSVIAGQTVAVTVNISFS